MILLLDIGNTHTHVGERAGSRIRQLGEIPTSFWMKPRAGEALEKLIPRRSRPEGVCLCSVVPKATTRARKLFQHQWKTECLVLNHETLRGVGIDYPHPASIGPDRLANAAAAFELFGAPSVVVDFGTAVTFDVVNARGQYAGGIIAPGLAAMTGYLHEKTALLPRIEIKEPRAAIGRNTEQAMLIGAVHGYRGLIKELLARVRADLKCRRLPVVATGGYAALIARRLPEIDRVDPQLTLRGLALIWDAHHA